MIQPGDGTIAKRMAAGLCPRCQTSMKPVEVHGHIQCATCKLVISECCSGEQACNVEEQTRLAGSLS